MGGKDPRVGGILAGALGSVGLPQATDALANAMPELSDSDRLNAVISLGLTPASTDTGIGALKDVLEDPALSSTAALALGNQARKITQADTESTTDTVDDLVQLLLDGYANATTVGERKSYLGALGNTGDERVLPVLEQVIDSAVPVLEAQATYSLRFIPGDMVDVLLAQQLARDVHTVQEQAIRAIGSRAPSLWRERLETVQSEMSPALQRRVELVLNTWK